jgi:hypothetical protein
MNKANTKATKKPDQLTISHIDTAIKQIKKHIGEPYLYLEPPHIRWHKK